MLRVDMERTRWAIKPGAYISAGYARKLRRNSYGVTVTFAVAVKRVVPLV